MTFERLKKGMTAKITGLTGAGANTIRLQEMGLTVGTIFKVVKIAPLGDPVEIDVRGYRLCLRKKETTEFEVEPIG